MSSTTRRGPNPPSQRSELLQRLGMAAEQSATDGILFHQAVADRVGLHSTDLRCLGILGQLQRATPGELSDRTGLTTGAVTRMLDRLERAGYVSREHDDVDRRRVMVKVVPKKAASLAPHYRGMAKGWAELLGRYSDQELALFVELFDGMHELTQRELANLKG
jgi:DNA-binding MarR family transcriptional regulator